MPSWFCSVKGQTQLSIPRYENVISFSFLFCLALPCLTSPWPHLLVTWPFGLGALLFGRGWGSSPFGRGGSRCTVLDPPTLIQILNGDITTWLDQGLPPGRGPPTPGASQCSSILLPSPWFHPVGLCVREAVAFPARFDTSAVCLVHPFVYQCEVSWSGPPPERPQPRPRPSPILTSKKKQQLYYSFPPLLKLFKALKLFKTLINAFKSF